MGSTYSGINIQYPISQLIISGKKVVETRTYPIPEHFVNQKLLIIETPGKKGKFKSRIIGFIIFGQSFKYSSSAEFYVDYRRHKVDKSSDWKWTSKGKWGWPIKAVEKFKFPIPAPEKKGIRYTNEIKI